MKYIKMAQAMIDILKNKNLTRTASEETKKKDKQTQCGDYIEFFNMFSPTKSIHFRWSKRENNYIICLGFSNQKQYLIRRKEWIKLRENFQKIDNVFNNYNGGPKNNKGGNNKTSFND